MTSSTPRCVHIDSNMPPPPFFFSHSNACGLRSPSHVLCFWTTAPQHMGGGGAATGAPTVVRQSLLRVKVGLLSQLCQRARGGLFPAGSSSAARELPSFTLSNLSPPHHRCLPPPTAAASPRPSRGSCQTGPRLAAEPRLMAAAATSGAGCSGGFGAWNDSSPLRRRHGSTQPSAPFPACRWPRPWPRRLSGPSTLGRAPPSPRCVWVQVEAAGARLLWGVGGGVGGPWASAGTRGGAIAFVPL